MDLALRVSGLGAVGCIGSAVVADPRGKRIGGGVDNAHVVRPQHVFSAVCRLADKVLGVACVAV